MGWLRRAAARWLKLPPEPRPPAGSEASVRVFRAAPNYYRYALARWGLRQVGVVIGVLFVFGSFFPFQDLLEFGIPAEAVDRIIARVPPAAWAAQLDLLRSVRCRTIRNGWCCQSARRSSGSRCSASC